LPRTTCIALPPAFEYSDGEAIMTIKARSAAGGILILAGLLTGCSHAEPAPSEYPMGEKIKLGPLTYTVLDSSWRSQLGDAFKLRPAQQRFLILTLSVTNGGGTDISIPLLSVENAEGQMFLESDNGEDVDNWFGLLRNISPAQTQQGRILFDVPLTSYRLRLTDGGGPGAEKYGWVTIPLRMDVDSDVQTPIPGGK
jgi:hypothetical protein